MSFLPARPNFSVGDVLAQIDDLVARQAKLQTRALFLVMGCGPLSSVLGPLTGRWTASAVPGILAAAALWELARRSRSIVRRIAELASDVAQADDVRVLPALEALYRRIPSRPIAGALAAGIEWRSGRDLTAADRRVIDKLGAQPQRSRYPELEAALRMGLSSERTLEFAAIKNPVVIPPRHQI